MTEAPTPPGWEGILAPDERILWQGRPDQGLHLSLDKLPTAGFGLLFAGFALVWMIAASRAGGGGFWLFGLLHFSVGVGLFGSSVLGDMIRRRATWYTLTDRRAYIATNLPWTGRTLESHLIGPDTRLSYHIGPPATITFARERRHSDKGRPYSVDIGFERIAEGDEVMRLLNQARDRTAPRPEDEPA